MRIPAYSIFPAFDFIRIQLSFPSSTNIPDVDHFQNALRGNRSDFRKSPGWRTHCHRAYFRKLFETIRGSP